MDRGVVVGREGGGEEGSVVVGRVAVVGREGWR